MFNWSQELLRYRFGIDYCQGKANRAVNVLLSFPQKSKDEEEKLWAENSQIFYWLQTLLINASLSGFSVTFLKLLPLHQIFICRTHILL